MTTTVDKRFVPVLYLPRLSVTSGTLEGVKWLCFALMCMDHINKYFFDGALVWAFNIGRLVLPLFFFTFAYQLASRQSSDTFHSKRLAVRLAISGSIASIPFIALGGLGWGWWPLNIMFTLLVGLGVAYCWSRGTLLFLALGVLIFFIGGAAVEYWWAGVGFFLASWRYSLRPSILSLLAMIASLVLLYIINKNFYALAALPIIFLLSQIDLRIPRIPHVFYWLYPLHLIFIFIFKESLL